MAIRKGHTDPRPTATNTPTAVSAYRLTLPYPPPTNRLTRRAGQILHPSKEATAYHRDVAAIAVRAGLRPYAGQIVITLHIYRPRRSGDLDGRIKVTLDALQNHAYLNDSQIVEIHAFRHDDKINPRAEVEIGEISALETSE